MKKQRFIICFFLLTGLTAGWPGWCAKKTEPWNTWLDEVAPIITRLELSVAKKLQTQEERDRFIHAFWLARAPSTSPPHRKNQYKLEYYRRLNYARHVLNGIKSDRGRIYMLLGAPGNKTTFTGHKGLVECELWNYEGQDRPGLLPFMNLIFFRPHDMGDFQLYHPGIHTPRHLLSPVYAARMNTRARALGQVKANSAELASASLSIIPGENTGNGISLSSSNFALNRIYSLPEREAEQSYIQRFKNPAGSVYVTHSTRQIRGHVYLTPLPNTPTSGDILLHYAVVPDNLNLIKTGPDEAGAELQLHISIETPDGKIVFQRERKIPFKADKKRQEELKLRNVVFRDSLPIVEGEFLVVVTFINAATNEFFTYKQTVTIPDPPGKGLYAVSGYRVDANRLKVLYDPRSTFSQKESIYGIVFSAAPPTVFLQQHNREKTNIPLTITGGNGSVYRFEQSLKAIPDDTYTLSVTRPGAAPVQRKLYILPQSITISRPFAMERPQPEGSGYNHLFIRAQQYLNLKQTLRSIACFEKIPATHWNGPLRPIAAKAYYLNGNHKKVIQLLEPETVKKEYPVLQMLANSSIELKEFPQALKYLQAIRKYGDTIEINQLIAATYLSLGDHKNSQLYYKRARQLKK